MQECGDNSSAVTWVKIGTGVGIELGTLFRSGTHPGKLTTLY